MMMIEEDIMDMNELSERDFTTDWIWNFWRELYMCQLYCACKVINYFSL